MKVPDVSFSGSFSILRGVCVFLEKRVHVGRFKCGTHPKKKNKPSHVSGGAIQEQVFFFFFNFFEPSEQHARAGLDFTFMCPGGWVGGLNLVGGC